MADMMTAEVAVSQAFHDQAPVWQLSAIPGIEAAACEWLPGCGAALTLTGTQDGIRQAAAVLADSWPAVARKILADVDPDVLDISVGIEYGIFSEGDTGYDVP